MKTRILTLIIFILSAAFTYATQLSDKAQVSLLTCTPGDELYTTFGHSALRVQDPEEGLDVVFNYGLFDFNDQHFVLKFIQGETYYCLGAQSYDDFIESNSAVGRKTYEQTLLLNTEQKEAIFIALCQKLADPTYLYNFVFDNCATRPLQHIENAYGKQLTAGDTQHTLTYRQIINQYSGQKTWLTFGINLIFGTDADKPITAHDGLFLPEQLAHSVAQTGLSNTDIPAFTTPQTPWWASNTLFYFALALFIVLVVVLEFKTHKIQYWADALIYLIYSILGLIACYLSFYSIHPLVQHNWNELFLNPLMLILFILTCIPKTRKALQPYQFYLAIVFLLLAIIRLLMPQAYHPIIWLPLLHAAIIIIRVLTKRITIKGINLRIPIVIGLLSCLPTLSYAQIPQLTVVVQVEGLSYEALNELRPHYRQGGLRTLEEDARKIEITYPFIVQGGVETATSLLTGVTPSINGIAGDNAFLRSDRQIHPVFEDISVEGIVTHQHLSPQAILSPTLTDNFRLRHGAAARIFAIGVHPNPTLALAGHAANTAIWIDAEKQQWATTTYFNDGLPTEADKMNISEHRQDVLSQTWQPSLDINAYLHTSKTEKRNKFSYPVNQYLTLTPAANRLVIDLALDIQKKRKLGNNGTPDLLLLSLSVLTPKSASASIESAEQEDMYLALNQDLGHLIEQLDHHIGVQNYQLILFGTPHYGISNQALESIKLQAQAFNIERAAALLNTYLMALYGHERWVDGYNGQSIFLNHHLIEQKNLSLSEIEEQICTFLLEFTGVRDAYTYNQIPLLNNSDATLLQNTQLKQQTGDVYLILQPLWYSQSSPTNSVFLTQPTSPLFIYTKQRTTITQETLPSTEVMKMCLELMR